MNGDSLVLHFKENFYLKQHFHFSLNEIEEMIPWKKQVYIALIEQYIKERESK